MILTLAFFCLLGTSTSHTRNATVNEVFYEVIKKENYFSQSDVRLQMSLLNRPELPTWMTFLQRNESSDALIYGTPSVTDSLQLQVVALDVNSYTTVTDKWTLNVRPERDPVNYIAEFWVTNFNIDDILDDDLPTHFLNIVRRIWADRIEVIKMVPLTDSNYMGRQPVPSGGGKLPKEGVAIQVGGPVSFSSGILNISQQVLSTCPGASTVAVDGLFSHMYTVDWCHFLLITRNGSTVSSSGQLMQSSFKPRERPVGRRDLSNEFILAVILPVLIALLLTLMLLYVMVFHREGRYKREMDTSNQQLEQYSTIRLSTSNLRTMSLKRTGDIQTNQSHAMYNTQSDQSEAAYSPSVAHTNSTRSEHKSDKDSMEYPPPIYNLQRT